MKKWVLRAFLGLAGLALLSIAALPTLLSTSFGKNRALDAIEGRIPGRIEMDDWSLGWISGIRVEALRYVSDDGRIDLTVPRIDAPRGLLKRLFSFRDLGEVTLSDPRLRLKASLESSAEEGKPAPSQKEGTPADATDLPEEAPVGIVFAFEGHILARNMVIEAVPADGKGIPALQKGNLDLYLQEADPSVRFTVSAVSGEGQGQISGNGTLNFDAGLMALHTAKGDARLEIKGWHLGPVMALLSTRADMPEGDGLLSASVTLASKAAEDPRADGRFVITDFHAKGGPLGEDHPHIDRMEGSFRGHRNHERIQIEELVLEAPFLKARASGWMAAAGEARIEGTGALNLSPTSRLFPRTLNLRKDLRIDEGTVLFKGHLERKDPSLQFQFNASMEKLLGASGGTPVAWNQPVRASATGSRKAGLWRLEEGSLSSSFLNASGKGDAADFNARAEMDIQNAIEQMGRVFHLEKWEGGGRLEMAMDLKETEKDRHRMAITVTGQEVRLQEGRETLIPAHAPEVRIGADIFSLKSASNSAAKEGRDLEVHMNTWMGKGVIHADRASMDFPTRRPRAEGLRFSGDLDLREFSNLFSRLGKWPSRTHLFGRSAVSLECDRLAGGVAEIRRITSETKAFQLVQPGRIVSDERLVAAAGPVRLDTASRKAECDALEITAKPGRLMVTNLEIGDWSRAAETMGLKAQLVADLKESLVMAPGFFPIPGEDRLEGALKADVTTAPGKEGLMAVSAEAAVSNFLYAPAKGKPLEGESIAFSAKATGDPAKNAWRMDHFSLSAPPTFTASGKASLDSVEEREMTAAVDGSLDLDLALLSPHLSALGIPSVTLSGKQAHAFQFSARTRQGEWHVLGPESRLTTALSARLIQGYGMDITDVTVPITLEKGVLTPRLKATVNEGTLAVAPEIHLDPANRHILLEPNQRLLADARLSKDLSNELLALIHPIFKGATSTSGTVGLEMDHFLWSLDKGPTETAFAGRMILKDVRLDTSGLFSGLLAALDIKERQVVFGKEPIDFSCKEGRITTSPMEIVIGGLPVSLTGTMGLDGNLDYVAETPVTPGLVGKKLYPFLEGTTIRVPIGGTVSDPVVDRRTLEAVVADLAAQAAGRQLQAPADAVKEKITREADRLLKKLLK